MRHGSLFSGIGGFDLAAEWMGWTNIFHCEKNEFCQRVLKHYWPHAELFDDITKSSFLKYRGTIDIITGGFPCQPYSQAGKRKGKADDRHLWPQMLRAIREIQPRWIVGENVRGITNWNKGLVFDEIQSDLEVEGYEITPFLLPACAINAPHRRDRVWFVAYSHDNGCNISISENEINASEGGKYALGNISPVSKPTITNINNIRCEGRVEGLQTAQEKRYGKKNNFGRELQPSWEGNSLPAPTICGMDDGIPDKVDRLVALGNAVVPQLVYQIFQTIEQYENQNNDQH